jgi:hypothetical protein
MADIVDVINLTTALDFSVTDLSIAETLPAGSTRQFTLHNTADDVQGSDQLESLWNNGQVDIQLNGVSITGYPFLSSWGNNIFDASTLVKGITKLSVAPVLATNPIAVGDNDPRLASAADVNPTPDTEMLRDGIGGGNEAGIAVGAEVLARIEAEAGEMADAAAAPAVDLGAVRLRRVLQQDQPAAAAERLEGGIATLALFCLLEVAVDGNGTVGSRHLQLAVDVTRPSHELGESWPSKDGVVGTLEGDYFEPEILRTVVCLSSESNLQFDASH